MRNLITSGSFLLGNIKGREFILRLDSIKKLLTKNHRKPFSKMLSTELGFLDFHTWHSRPIRSADVNIDSLDINESDTAIVVQGPLIKEWKFTEETLLLYKKHFPKSPIIFSTWENEDEKILHFLKDQGIHVVLSRFPEKSGLANLNFQLVSSKNGVLLAEQLGSKYTVKTRSDQRYYSPLFLSTLKAELEVATRTWNSLNDSPLAILDVDTFRYRLYGVSDFMTFGPTASVLQYWSCELDPRGNVPLGKEHFETLFSQSIAQLPETYFAVRYLESLGADLGWTVQDWWQKAATYFVVVDSSSLDFFWPKYSRREHRWKYYGENSDLSPLDNSLWKVLQTKFQNINFNNLEERLHRKIN